MSRTTKSVATMSVLAAVFVIGSLVGVRLLTAAAPALPVDQGAECEPRTIRAGGTLKAAAVTVDVYNASAISGLANRTMLDLGKAGFQSGRVANLPSQVEAGRQVTIWTSGRSSGPVRLVAKQFKGQVSYLKRPGAQSDLVRVVVGANYPGVDKKAPTTLKTKDSTKVCVPVEPDVG